MTTTSVVSCKRCRNGAMHPIERQELFYPPGKEVVVTTLAARCDNCGIETVLSSQMNENITRRNARQAHYGEYLLGEDIFAFRRNYGLSQLAASKIFGKGKIAFSRYENEKSFPESSTTKLLRMAIRFPQMLKALADESQVEIPLWEARCAEDRVNKLRQFKTVENPVVIEEVLAFDLEYPENTVAEAPLLEVAFG